MRDEMIIECEEDPWKLIQEIGDPSFSICDENWDEVYRHPNHPDTLRIIDCEDNQHIDITGESVEDTRRMAENLCRLLNQAYWRPGVREQNNPWYKTESGKQQLLDVLNKKFKFYKDGTIQER